MVTGDYDEGSIFPELRVLQVGAFKIGVVHRVVPWDSQGALARMRQKLQVDSLILGHSHKNQVRVADDGSCFINPGSITGASLALNHAVTPSFILLAVQDDNFFGHVYELVNGEVEVCKTEVSKKEKKAEPPTASSDPALLQSLPA